MDQVVGPSRELSCLLQWLIPHLLLRLSSENSQISAERPRGIVAKSPTLSLSFDANHLISQGLKHPAESI